MSDPRDALLEKFRANLRARVQRLRDMLEILGQVPDNADASSQVLGELHTLKGEARLLGLVQLSELAHVLETLLSQVDAAAIAKADVALDAMARALADQVSREQADALITTVLERFQTQSEKQVPACTERQAAPELEPPKKVETSPEPTPKADEIPVNIGASGSWVQVEASLIDDLCEAMAAISGDFGRIFAGVNRLVATAGTERASSGVRQQGSLLIEECARFRTALDNATVHTWELRMVPAQPLLRELASHAQQLATAANKEVDVIVEAGGVQIERDALDKIWDAMIHLVRNSIDHGDRKSVV